MENQTLLTTDVAAAATRYVKERDYWLENLSGALTSSYFPYDKPEPQKRHMETLSFDISGDLFAQLSKVSTGKDLRLHILLTAAVVLLLHRYTRHPDILVGTPIYKQESEGDFINTILTLRNPINENGTLKELLLLLRKTLAQAVEHQNYPMDALLYQLNMQVSGNRFPLFDCAVLLESLHHISYLDHIPINTIFSFSKNETNITGTLHYNRYLYEAETIPRIIDHFKILLREVSFNLDSPVCTVEMVSDKEKNLLLNQWNQTDRDYPRDKTIHSLFSEQARKTPDNIALICGRHSYTYRQLDHESSRLAGLLPAKGVKPGDIVAIKIKRSIHMLTGILAILKTGAAYMPIDPDYPQDRIDFMMADSNAKVLLEDVGNRLACSSPSYQAPGTPQLATSPAYIMYTSGSTGRPKGVIINHQSAVRLVKNTNYISFREDDRILQTGAIVFDAVTFEMWGALLNGLGLYLTDDHTLLDPHKLAGYLKSNLITILWLTSALFNHLSLQDPTIFSPLRVLLVGGDVLNPTQINRVGNACKNLQIINGYGPTENTTFSTTYSIQNDFQGNIPIGKPIANTTAYIIDSEGRLQPVGAVGELCFSGHGLAEGYLNQPELTAEKFISIEFNRSRPTRLYRTGDLARWLGDGNIEFLGRMDDQVKIRGFRIEPGEIQNKLLQYQAVEEALVTVHTDETGEKSLCAYAVGDFNTKSLKDFLAQSLPDYMIPAYFVRLEQMPYTHTGKIDRKLLLDAREFLASGNTYMPPRNPGEEDIVRIWSEAVKLEEEKIGIDDSFFEIGGNSINVLKVQNKINQVFDLELSMSCMFLYPTIRQLSEHIYSLSQAGEPDCESESMIKLNHGRNRKNLFIIHPKHGMIYQYKELARLLEDRYNVFGIQAAGLVSDTPLPQTMEEMFLEYKEQIKAVQPEGPYLIAGYCLGAVLAYEIAREFEDDGLEIEQLIIFDMQAFLPDSYIRKLRAREFAAKMVLKVPFISSNREKSNAEIGDIHSPEPPKNHSLSIDTEKQKKAVEQNNQILPRTYRPRRIINSPVLLFKAEETKHPRLTLKYWQKLTRGNVTFIGIPGDHDTIFETPYVEKVAFILKSKLKEK